MILENSMLSKEKLTYLLKIESTSPLNNDKRYKRCKRYKGKKQDFGEYSMWWRHQNPKSAEVVGERASFTKVLGFYKFQILNKIQTGFIHISIISWHFR